MSQAIGAFRGRHADNFGAISADLPRKKARVVAGGERGHAQTIRMRVNDREGALAD